MPTRKEVLMRSANLLNDFAFKYVFGEDCKEANDALKSLLTVFLERKVEHVVVKNSEMVKDYTKMKSPRLDLLVEFDDRTTVDLEMQLRQTKDNLPIRFSYYLARLHGSQELEGKYYGELKETIVLVFFNVNLIDNHRMCNTFTLKNEDGLSFVKETEDRMKIRTVEMAKLDVNKPLEEMNEQEKMIYYFLNCHKGMDDSKIKAMIESDGVIQMLEKRVETISDDGWKKIIEDFRKLHENEERMERQLELEEAQKAKEEARKVLQEANKLKQEASKLKQEVNKLKQEADKKVEEADKKVERANKQVEDATKQTELETKRADVAEKQIQDMILRLSSTMDVKAMAILLNMSVDEIKKYI
jgi:predicted transposase/invertase (TIGR01784 family)